MLVFIVISEVQCVFVGGRRLIDGVMLSNEVWDSMRKRGRKGVFIKLDLDEKAYDSVDWDFFMEVMQMMNFGGKKRRKENGLKNVYLQQEFRY